ncbi:MULTISPECIES: SAM-dependent methyltransferase [Streptomyces]|uniref:Methyltransferase domain protein n=1 Tax=Streptomyces griseofuscus TaxID=146922 RepID=A0A7H1PR00_9ACTN|nr:MULTISPECIES: class I SAM-dependent methyltransferase [Streptomyces]MBA9050427.1 cyclopropane fatty-acyl-phospholipid synthase-like methyltransferase [Streptomyces murinus]QNT90480.1 Methyltransferase domain protein [Streptomyces griseofuscus]BBC91342.1 class I SAM-dependent methyltransferase [Streptomyces rochei]
MNGTDESTYEVLPSRQSDPFRDHVVRAYEDSPADWQKVIGEQLHFQWGVFGHPDAPRPVSLDEAGLRYLEQQLALATGERTGHTRPQRILDVGCGWGATLRHLAQVFPGCPRLDGVNISAEQLAHCAGLVRDVPRPGRVRLYLCDAADIAELPDPEQPYDLALARGVITHLPPRVYEAATAALSRRMRPGSLLVVSETLYSEEFLAREPRLPADADHLALEHRKSLRYVTDVMRDNGFRIRDERVLPCAEDAARWVLELKSNIDVHFPKEASPPLEAIRRMAADLAVALLRREASVHSIVAERIPA